jgi:hypothetical protein
MELADLKQIVPGLAAKSHRDKIKILGWFLHVHKGKIAFSGSDIGRCYGELHFAAPKSFGPYFKPLFERKELLKVGGAYKLENKIREALDQKYGAPERTIKITTLLKSLPAKIPDMAERTYLNEALICYHNLAFRAAVVMTWNLTYHHLCDHVLKNRLAEFNTRWQASYPGMHKNKLKAIVMMDDFGNELKESEVLNICRDAGIITKNIYNILHAALGRRNAAAHPSGVVIDQLQTDAYIADLVTNVVLKVA